jgi:hypothetical protein
VHGIEYQTNKYIAAAVLNTRATRHMLAALERVVYVSHSSHGTHPHPHMYRCVNFLLQVAIGKECSFKRSSFQARGQTRFVIVLHIIVHANAAITIHVALLNHFIDTTE